MRLWCVLCFVVLVVADTNAVAGPTNDTVTTAVSASVLGPGGAALTLQHLAMMVLRAAGVEAAEAPAPPSCNIPDQPACLKDTLRALTSGSSAHVALVVVPADATPPAWELHESGIQELGEITAPSRRACLATTSHARSLLDLADPAIAANYYLPQEEIQRLLDPCNEPNCHNNWIPEWCRSGTCATLLTSVDGEAKVLWNEVQRHHLYAVIRPLGEHLSKVTSVFAARSMIACDWAPELTSLSDLQAQILSPPPCISSPCSFETRRVVKYIKVRELAKAPSAVRALVRLNISKEDMKILIRDAATKGPEEAARLYLEAHPNTAQGSEVRVAVLLPHETAREAYSAHALAAAAILVEEDVAAEQKPGAPRFKVQIHDDQCHSQGASKYLQDSVVSSEFGAFGALSALAGPACGAVWEKFVQHAATYKLPMLAYTPQAPASLVKDPTDTQLQLLAAGDAREAASALTALVGRLGWRRVAALNEPATRPLLDAMREKTNLAVYTELPENGSNVGLERIQHWATQASSEHANILYLCVEDARIARAAMCAARAVGLTPAAGAVWLLCNAHEPGWLEAKPGEGCTTEQLEEMAEGHFSVTPEWSVIWQRSSGNATQKRRDWEKRWREKCHRVSLAAKTEDDCSESPGPSAALLYDALRLWTVGLYKLLEKNRTAVDDMHNPKYVKFLLQETTTNSYNGLTGPIKWKTEDGAYTRVISLVLSQWDSKTGARNIGNWTKDSFTLNDAALKWYTADGKMPDDGSEKCSLQGLADALHSDCRTAFVALCAILITILIAVLSGIALYCKKRTEKEYRKRLQELGMRPIAIKPIGLDRWEVPRERVVINRKLGTGAFGTVYGGHALLAEDRGWSAVAVKTLKAGANTDEKLDFLSEAEAMKRFDHKNVVRLLGVVTKTEPVCTVMEFMLYGDLKNYLLARRHLAVGGGIEESEGLEVDEASPKRLTSMALDVARALSYLAQLKYVHRDVAARNCLVSAKRVVKLADFGMTRLVFENDYYRFSRKGMLPVRWMAPESLALGVFSPASDVWSFGVLLYEIVTFGSLPFQGLSNSEVLSKVKGGQTLELPLGLKPQLEGLIKSCWHQDPKVRPTASEVAAFLADAPRLLSPCLDVPLDALPLDGDPPWRLPRDQAEARWVSWAAPASAATDTTYLSTDGQIPLDTDSFLP